jgi:hypothetical protein
VYGEVCVEADGMNVEQRDKRRARVIGEFGKYFGTNGCGRDNEGIRSQSVRLREPRL